MKRASMSAALLALVLLWTASTAVWAVPPQPHTFFGAVQIGGDDSSDGTAVSAWLGGTHPAAGAPVAFPEAGVSITFAPGCAGDVTAQRKAGSAQVFSPGPETSVYVLDAQGSETWDPPGDPAEEGLAVTFKVSDTVATSATWQMGAVEPLTLTVDALAGDLPYAPQNVVLLGDEWDLAATCSGFSASVAFGYSETALGGVGEADIAGMARYDALNNWWEYLPGTVDTGANTVTVDDVTAFSRWRLLASVPPAAVAGLAASQSGTDLVLDWPAVTGDLLGAPAAGVTYNVYRAAGEPFFDPTGTPHATTAGLSHPDAGAMGDPNTDYFYAVTAVNGAGVEGAVGQRAGMARFEIPAGASLISPVLGPPSTASELPVEVEMACRWESTTDTWACHEAGLPFNDFPLEVPQGYFLMATAPATLEREGVLPVNPVPVALNPVWTLMGLPLLPQTMTAEGLLQDATAHGGDCSEIHRWLNGTWDGHLRGLPSNNFALDPEQGYLVLCEQAIEYLPSAGGATGGTAAPLAHRPALLPDANSTISDVLVTNRRDVAFTVTWRTNQPSTGWVEYAEDLTGFQNLSGLVAHDDQGEATVSRVHQVTLTGLAPETTYAFRVHSGDTIDDNGGALYQVTTKATELPPVPYLAYGQVETLEGTPAGGALVRGWLVDGEGQEMEPLSTLVDGYGYWSLNLPLQDCEGVQLRLQVHGHRGNEAALTQPACEVKPAPMVVLLESGRNQTYLPLILR